MADIKSSLMGRVAVAAGYLTEEQLDQCLQDQLELEQAGSPARLGEIMKHRGFITEDVLQNILDVQRTLSNGLFGEIAVRMKHATAEQVDRSFNIQAKARQMGYQPGLIGEIMVEQGFLDGGHVLKILEAQEQYTLKCRNCGMKFNAWKLKPGQKINCAMCGDLLHFNPTIIPGGTAAVPDAPAAAAPATEHSLFPEIPGYTIYRQLGESEDSVLYEATQDAKSRRVTIEHMTGVSAEDAVFMERLQTEAKAAVSLHHPAIKNIFAIGHYQGHPYIVIEYLDSESLFNVVQREKTLPLLGATQIIIQIAEALKAAHEKGIVHGDIKPSLILFQEDGTVKISKLGVAKRLRKDMLSMDDRARFVTSYMAPELIIGRNDPDLAADMYALGAVYFHLLTGSPPFEGSSPKEIIISISGGLRPILRQMPHIPPSAADLIERMLSSARTERPRNYDALIMELNQVRGGAGPGVPRMVSKKDSGPNRTTAIDPEVRDFPRRATRTAADGTVMGEVVRGTDGKKTSGLAVFVRVMGVLTIIAAAGLIYWFLLRDNPSPSMQDRFVLQEEQDRARDAARQQAFQPPPPPVTPAGPDPAELERIIATVDQDIMNYNAARDGLGGLRTRFGDRQDLTRAQERIDNKRLGVARDRLPQTAAAIDAQIKAGEFTQAQAAVDAYVNAFYGLEEARTIEQKGRDIPGMIAERFFDIKGRAEILAKQGQYDEAVTLLEGIVQNFGQPKWVDQARELQAGLRREQAARQAEAKVGTGVDRLKLITVYRDALRRQLRCLDIKAARKQLGQFRGDPDGSQLAKVQEAFGREIVLVEGLRDRLTAMINRGSLVQHIRTPGSDEAFPVKSADEQGVSTGSVSLQWSKLAPADLRDMAAKTCDLQNGEHLAQLALFTAAWADTDLALTWLSRSQAKGFDVEAIRLLFDTRADAEAEALYRQGLAAFEANNWSAAVTAFSRLVNDFSDSAVMLKVGRDKVNEMIKTAQDRTRPQDDTKRRPPGETPGPAAVTPVTDLQLHFHKPEDMKFITIESGIWCIEDETLAGRNDTRARGNFAVRIAAVEPVRISGKVRFEMAAAAISVQMGETRLMLNIAENRVYFFDALKTRKEMNYACAINQWHDFEIRIDRAAKKVHWRVGAASATGECDMFGNDIVLMVDQENRVFFDDLAISMTGLVDTKAAP
ncbi:MAG: protein kinase [Planctomycetota bacterium]